MAFDKLVKTSQGRTLISLLLGFGLATMLFHNVCIHEKCFTEYAVNPSQIVDKTFRTSEKNVCVTYSYVPTKCSGDVIHFE